MGPTPDLLALFALLLKWVHFSSTASKARVEPPRIMCAISDHNTQQALGASNKFRVNFFHKVSRPASLIARSLSVYN